MSDRLRCALGSGEACASGARAELYLGHEDAGLSFAARGCALASAQSCTLAGDTCFLGFGGRAQVPRDVRRARPFYRESCALGDEEGCRKLHVVELHGRCEQQSASACHELADVYRSGEISRDTAAAARFLQQACLLGDTEACKGGR
jgi:TPR repeat protein